METSLQDFGEPFSRLMVLSPSTLLGTMSMSNGTAEGLSRVIDGVKRYSGGVIKMENIFPGLAG